MSEIGEDTNVVVRKMLEKRRSSRVPVIIGCLIALVFLIYMGIEFGPQHQDKLTVEGPVYDGKTMTAPPQSGSDSAPKGGADHHDKSAPGQSGSVQVIIAGRTPQLWVDGKPMAAKREQTLTLSAGKHVLMLREDTRTVMQRLYIEAGESYRVESHGKVTVTQIK